MIPVIPKNAKRYYDLNTFLRHHFGCKVHKIVIDAGFTCPNRDGRVATGGCIYCHEGSGHSTLGSAYPVREQLVRGREYLRERTGAQKFIAYFQRYTNTYAPVEILKGLYNEALSVEDVVGLSIGTRPDCVSDPVLDLLEGYARYYHVWIEYGLQSIHERTLRLINRGHGPEAFIDAVRRAKGRGIYIGAHVILGLPGETREDMLETARAIAALGLDGIKIHLLYVLRGTVLETMYNRGDFEVLRIEEYVKLVCDFLELLPKTMVIHRLTGDAPKDLLVAPLWSLNKLQVLNEIERELERRGSCQGKKYNDRKESIVGANVPVRPEPM